MKAGRKQKGISFSMLCIFVDDRRSVSSCQRRMWVAYPTDITVDYNFVFMSIQTN